MTPEQKLLLHTRALGARHLGYGVRAADYASVGDAPLACNLVAETMLDGAAATRPIGS
jgi:hypothetical protein